MCNAQRSFAEDFGFAYKGGILESLDYDVTVGNGIEMLDFIMEVKSSKCFDASHDFSNDQSSLINNCYSAEYFVMR